MRVLAWAVLLLAALEGLLWVAGAATLLARDLRDRLRIGGQNEFRILCLGESTTAFQYPPLLEEQLNRRSRGTRFVVLDAGVPGTNSTGILSRLEPQLEDFKPHLVIAMMGINDPMNIRSFLPDGPVPAPLALVKRLRLYRLLLVARERWFPEDRGATTAAPLPDADLPLERERPGVGGAAAPAGTDHYLEGIALLYQGEAEAAAARLEEASRLHPGDARPLLALGKLRSREQAREAEALYRRAAALTPGDSLPLIYLGQLYRKSREPGKAREMFEAAVTAEPDDAQAHKYLGRYFLESGDLAPAEAELERSLELDPEDNDARFLLSQLYIRSGRGAAADRTLLEAVEINDRHRDVARAMSGVLAAQGREAELNLMFRRSVHLSVLNDSFFGMLAVNALREGNVAESDRLFQRAEALRLSYYNPVTRLNWRRLAEMTRRRSIQLACMQYPMRSLEPLRRMLPSAAGPLFVDNEAVFKQAVRDGSYEDYFGDAFGGDFGHCSRRGNELLAAHIIDSLAPLRERTHPVAPSR